jgi:hypothetical protein
MHAAKLAVTCCGGSPATVKLITYQNLQPIQIKFLNIKYVINIDRHRTNIYTPDHQLLDSAHNFGSLISCWEINNFENC